MQQRDRCTGETCQEQMLGETDVKRHKWKAETDMKVAQMHRTRDRCNGDTNAKLIYMCLAQMLKKARQMER